MRLFCDQCGTEFGDGRSMATGELRHGDVVTAEAVARFITDRTK